ncbi:uncharacterized protein LOC106088950 [Stomoxys calcitrans]|uniref:uncharacterized protein LOC106088950 n=1 Tax=Stomoxys calcitrans TaxID=35570 RepID=UPI0027E382F5|nr:uncharacterized protein LOC106088950 [Stomoxys calcitrans]
MNSNNRTKNHFENDSDDPPVPKPRQRTLKDLENINKGTRAVKFTSDGRKVQIPLDYNAIADIFPSMDHKAMGDNNLKAIENEPGCPIPSIDPKLLSVKEHPKELLAPENNVKDTPRSRALKHAEHLESCNLSLCTDDETPTQDHTFTIENIQTQTDETFYHLMPCYHSTFVRNGPQSHSTPMLAVIGSKDYQFSLSPKQSKTKKLTLCFIILWLILSQIYIFLNIMSWLLQIDLQMDFSSHLNKFVKPHFWYREEIEMPKTSTQLLLDFFKSLWS